MTLSTDTLFCRRQWRSFFALLAATAALIGAQALAPSSAQAMIYQNLTEKECNDLFGTWDWFNETCDLNFGGGGSGDGDGAGSGDGDLEVGPGGVGDPPSPFPDGWVFDEDGSEELDEEVIIWDEEDPDEVTIRDETEPEEWQREIAEREREYWRAWDEANRAQALQLDVRVMQGTWRAQRVEELEAAREMMQREQRRAREEAKRNARQEGGQRHGRNGKKANRSPGRQ